MPAFPQEPEEDAKGPSFVCGQNTGHVLPYQPAGAKASNEITKCDGERATIASKPRSKASDGEILAGRSTDNKVN